MDCLVNIKEHIPDMHCERALCLQCGISMFTYTFELLCVAVNGPYILRLRHRIERRLRADAMASAAEALRQRQNIGEYAQDE